jgi:hypothetical protein
MTYFKKSIKENFDTMKKNVMLKIASVLMVAVLLTTCAISSTFAKYVSTPANDSVEARAAKWGLALTAKAPTSGSTDADIFKKVYADGSGNSIVASVDNVTLLVAPGTSNKTADVFGFTVNGKPEVAVLLKADINVTLSNWTANGEYYCPVDFYINDVKVTLSEKTNDSTLDAADYELCIEEAIAKALFGVVPSKDGGKYNKIYEPNTDFSAAGVGDVKITWEWLDVEANNAKDTALGDAAATVSTTDDPTITIAYTVEAEQSLTGVAA